MCTGDVKKVGNWFLQGYDVMTGGVLGPNDNAFQVLGDTLGLMAPAMPKPPDPLKPADPANKGAEDLWSPKGLKDSQALAARLGTNALVVPFQSTNII